MEGFKPVIKMKTGGSVSKAIAAAEKKEARSVMHEDIKEDKKLVKKAINLHDDQLHEGAKTDLTTLKKGGRCKKDGGTVRKYKCGGEVKKMAIGGLTDPTTQAIVNADVLRRRKAGMGATPAGLAAPNAVPAQNPGAQPPAPVMKKGGKVKKMADGGSTGGTEPDPRDTANQKWTGQKKLLQMDVARGQSKDPIKRAANYVFGGSDAQSKITAGDALANIREQQMESDLATKKKRGGKVCK